MAAMTGASGARVWLQAQHASWLTPRRMRVVTVSMVAAALVGSSATLSGTDSAGGDQPQPKPAQQDQPIR
jgi:hypothetical protein